MKESHFFADITLEQCSELEFTCITLLILIPMVYIIILLSMDFLRFFQIYTKKKEDGVSVLTKELLDGSILLVLILCTACCFFVMAQVIPLQCGASFSIQEK